MTRNEFIEDVNCWSDLIDFCCDYGCDYCSDVYDDEQKDDYFDEILIEMAENASSWQELRESLNDIPTGYDYYIQDAYGDWSGADGGDFDEHKEDILYWADNCEIWDEEDADEEYEDERSCDVDDTDEDLTDEEFEDGCPLGELFMSCTSSLQTIKIAAEQERKQEELEFKQLISQVI